MSQTHEFKAEVQKLLQIITHSIYTNREIFLRELISNSSDALDKLRFAQSKGEAVHSPDLELTISIEPDADNRKLVISDTGVGMNEAEVIDNLGTIARSGSEQFLKQLAEQAQESHDANIIGRFGVGFYSVFMAADKVEVRTRSFRPDDTPVLWRSDGLGGYEVEQLDDPDMARGTRIEIFLKDDAEEFADKERLKHIIKTHSNFISFPILVEEEKVNTIPALWRENKFDISNEQYDEFYKFLTYDHQEPLDRLHVAVDAPVQFTALVFTPKTGKDVFGMDRDNYGLDLYVRRVLIQRQYKELIPEYLGFLAGVVDTEDLPLNISRETLQENALIRKIKTTLTKQALTHLGKVAKENAQIYEEIWRAHGKQLKLGYNDFANREKLAPLMRFNSSIHEDSKGLTSFEDYVARMKTDQKVIYYVTGASREAVRLNPHLEIFRKKGVEVLYCYEPVDDFLMDGLEKFGEHELTSVEHADLSAIEHLPDVEEQENKVEELPEEEKGSLDSLLQSMKEILGERVTDIVISKRLQSSPACLVSPDGGMTSQMQKIMRIMGKDDTPPPKRMEINQDHPLVRSLLKIYKADPADQHIRTATEQLYESSLLLEGYLTDPHAMVDRINKLLENASSWYTEIKHL